MRGGIPKDEEKAQAQEVHMKEPPTPPHTLTNPPNRCPQPAKVPLGEHNAATECTLQSSKGW